MCAIGFKVEEPVLADDLKLYHHQHHHHRLGGRDQVDTHPELYNALLSRILATWVKTIQKPKYSDKPISK